MPPAFTRARAEKSFFFKQAAARQLWARSRSSNCSLSSPSLPFRPRVAGPVAATARRPPRSSLVAPSLPGRACARAIADGAADDGAASRDPPPGLPPPDTPPPGSAQSPDPAPQTAPISAPVASAACTAQPRPQSRVARKAIPPPHPLGLPITQAQHLRRSHQRQLRFSPAVAAEVQKLLQLDSFCVEEYVVLHGVCSSLTGRLGRKPHSI